MTKSITFCLILMGNMFSDTNAKDYFIHLKPLSLLKLEVDRTKVNMCKLNEITIR